MIIDFHNHYYPPEYLEELRRGSSRYRITEDADGNPVLHSPGDYNIVVPGHRDAAFRTTVLDDAGVDRQVITFTAPGTAMETPERAVELCRIVNDALAKVVATYPDRYATLATLPMQDPQAATAELLRVMDELGLKGAMLYSNASGVALSDRRFWPLYEKAAERDAVLYIHPTYPVGVEAMTEYMLMPMVGFLMDTTLAAASLVYSGTMERFQGIRWVLAHLGGAVPYMAERFDRGFEAYPECREHIRTPPSEQLSRCYYDTVNFNPDALAFTIRFAGVDRILAGSDYPHQIGSLAKMKSSLAAVDLSDGDRAKILGGNAARLLGL
ncbi:MAG: amidohydrolase family protein [Gemmatimonadota bacterium]